LAMYHNGKYYAIRENRTANNNVKLYIISDQKVNRTTISRKDVQTVTYFDKLRIKFNSWLSIAR
jgi:hypothetical protein